MTKEISQNMERAIFEVVTIALAYSTLDILSKKVESIYCRYFPCFDEILLNSFTDFAFSVRATYLSKETISLEVNRYIGENADKCI